MPRVSFQAQPCDNTIANSINIGWYACDGEEEEGGGGKWVSYNSEEPQIVFFFRNKIQSYRNEMRPALRNFDIVAF